MKDRLEELKREAVEKSVEQCLQSIKNEQQKVLKGFLKYIMGQIEQELYDFYFAVTWFYYDRYEPEQYQRHDPLSSTWHGHKIPNRKNVGYNLYQAIEFHKVRDQVLNIFTDFKIEFNLSNLQNYQPNGFTKRQIFNMIYYKGEETFVRKGESAPRSWLNNKFHFEGKFVKITGRSYTNVIKLIQESFDTDNPYFANGIVQELEQYLLRCKSNDKKYPWLSAGIYG